MNNLRCLLVIVVLVLVDLSLWAQPLSQVSPSSVGLSRLHLGYADKAIEKEIAESHIPGAVFAVVKDGKLAYLKAYGNKSLKPSVEPMTTSTIFDVASCTKSMATAISAMILIERGQLSLRDDLDYYIPDFNKGKNYNGKKCTIRKRNLLTHTSGIVSYVSPTTLTSKYREADRSALIEYAKTSNLRFVPDTGFEYSCLNFILLQHVIEQISGQSLREFAKQNIFQPLGMSHTDYLPLGDANSDAWADIKDIAPTEVVSSSNIIRGVVHDPLASVVGKGVSGNAGLFSTASDAAILAAMLLGDGSYNGVRILSPLTVQAMRSVPDESISLGRALGWDVSSAYSSSRGDLLGDETFSHTGFTGPSIMLDKENNIAVILMTNGIHLSGYKSKYLVRLRALVANCVAASIISPTLK